MPKIRKIALVLLISMLSFGCAAEVEDSPTQDSDVVVNQLANTSVLIVDSEMSDSFIIDISDSVSENGAAVVRLELRSQDSSVEVIGEQVSNGSVSIPALSPLQGSTVDVYLNGFLYGGIDVYTTTALPAVPDGLEHAVLFQGPSFMVVDMSRVDGSGPETISGTEMVDDIASSHDNIGRISQALSNCGNNISGPGVGRFLSSSPGPFGQRYSYCPESVPTLNWAGQGDFAIDALYNQYWGCTQAIKVPNNCTYTVDASNNRYYCCGFPHYKPSIINPSTDPYFPDCPLSN